MRARPHTSRACVSDFSVPASLDSGFHTIRLPFSDFSDRWAPPTGEHVSTCSTDPSTCVTAKALASIQRLEVWAEGANGQIDLEIQSIYAEVV